MTEELERKIRIGDGLTDAELETALAFYANMESGLRLLGSHFHHAWVDVSGVHRRLQEYHKCRTQHA